MNDLSKYKINLYQNPETGHWSWAGINPDGKEFGPGLGYFVRGHVTREGAEKEASEWLPTEPTETITGLELRERLEQR